MMQTLRVFCSEVYSGAEWAARYFTVDSRHQVASQLVSLLLWCSSGSTDAESVTCNSNNVLH